MSASEYLYRVIMSNLLTLFYSFMVLVAIVINYLKNPFKNPWAQKLKLEPPSRLTDPKYGVHKYIKVNNIKIHYVESGDPSKPLMIFLHGFPEFWYSWRHQIVDFKKDYWCIAVDMRGFGDSERPESVSSYKLELLTEDIRDLVRQLGREKCILVSHDWGGLIACRFRDIYPDVLSGIIVLASASRESWFNEVWSNDKQRKMSWYVFLYRVPVLPEWSMLMNDIAIFEEHMFKKDNKNVDSEDIECYKYWFRKPYALTPPINYYRANFGYTLPKKEMKEENVPMLVALAAKDRYINHNLLETMKAEYSVIETTIVENAGHFLQQESPEVVNKIIREFLTNHNI